MAVGNLRQAGKWLVVWIASNWVWGLVGSAIVGTLYGVAGAVLGFANPYVFVSLLLLAFAFAPRALRPARAALRGGELSVQIEREDWDSFRHEAFILQVKVRIRNRSKKTKRIKGYELRFGGRPSGASSPTNDAHQEVESRRRRLPQLERHSVLEPKEEVSGWLVYALPWSSDPGPTEYTLSVREELNYDYEARGRSTPRRARL